MALSEKNAPKAAARRIALPSERKPSRFVYSNTTAIGVAVAEFTLAARAAQRRAEMLASHPCQCQCVMACLPVRQKYSSHTATRQVGWYSCMYVETLDELDS